ncbi:OLC1v1012213C1 [Oldenlandia corymbosa var. corymbosa]|uniref:OLC1v1012213C1 n=1 Tax=Oldenlandia corymbosa var. corymbosa TaxID=529605 RepID=A0AAV1DVJ3_OLDCO|nr:OLC1v1012213C1 [Oldenlandia corymbosa var. corymbosa]
MAPKIVATMLFVVFVLMSTSLTAKSESYDEWRIETCIGNICDYLKSLCEISDCNSDGNDKRACLRGCVDQWRACAHECRLHSPHPPPRIGRGCFEAFEEINILPSLVKSMKNGSDSNISGMKLNVRVGTHVDTPGHIYDHYYDAGFDVDSLDLRVLNGPALVVDIPRDKNITGILNPVKIHD